MEMLNNWQSGNAIDDLEILLKSNIIIWLLVSGGTLIVKIIFFKMLHSG